MTLHISLICDAYVLQIGDRLLSAKRGNGLREWDPLANKSIFVHARNGLLAIGYAGLAHIAGMPTDEWLTEIISHRKPVRMSSGGNGMWFGSPLNITVGQVETSIKEAVERRLPRERHHKHGIEVLLSGWTWPRNVGQGNARPSTFCRSISHDGSTDHACITERFPRRHFARESRGWQIVSIGAGSNRLLQSITDEMRERRTIADDVEAIIVRLIREYAARPNSGVGTDLMSIYLPIAAPETPRIRFLRNDSRTVDAYTPSLISTGGAIIYPMLIQGRADNSFIYGGTDADPVGVKLEVVPALENQRHLSSVRSQPRRNF